MRNQEDSARTFLRAAAQEAFHPLQRQGDAGFFAQRGIAISRFPRKGAVVLTAPGGGRLRLKIEGEVTDERILGELLFLAYCSPSPDFIYGDEDFRHGRARPSLALEAALLGKRVRQFIATLGNETAAREPRRRLGIVWPRGFRILGSTLARYIGWMKRKCSPVAEMRKAA